MVVIRKTCLRVLAFCQINALSLTSLAIALMGLYLTITAQSDERAHKELLLRPDLSLEVQVRDYSVVIANRGLGPALITEMLYYLEGQCGAVDRRNLEGFVKIDVVSVGRSLTRFFSQQFTELTWGAWNSLQGIQSQLPLPTQIIAVGQQIALFKLEPELVVEVNKKLVDSGFGRRAAFNDEFVRHSMSMPLRVRYCSMSEKHCEASIVSSLPCQFKEIHTASIPILIR